MPRATLSQPPDGFHYHPDFLSVAEERALLDTIMTLEFSEVRMHGVAAKRRVAHFGWIYGYESWRLTRGPQVPEFCCHCGNVRHIFSTMNRQICRKSWSRNIHQTQASAGIATRRCSGRRWRVSHRIGVPISFSSERCRSV